MITILSSNNYKDIEILADRFAFINNDLIWLFLNVNKLKNLHYFLTIEKFDDLDDIMDSVDLLNKQVFKESPTTITYKI
jgi:hypothetical protein